MLILIDPNSGVPVYRQLIDQIRFLVASGLLSPGDELPSTRTLSTELGINPMTVSKAFSLLEDEGLLTRRPGLPLVVRERDREEADVDREERLRTLLEPAALAARQLELSPTRAVAIFRRLLAEIVTEESAR